MKPVDKRNLNVGDIVYLNVLKDNRDWGYNPGPDGTKCEFVSYDCKSQNGEPNKYWPTIRFLDGEMRGEKKRILILHLSVSPLPTKKIKRKIKYTELFGNVIDQWEVLPNDIKTDPAMCKLNEAMELVLKEVE